jgi:uncharacterized protein with ParB-like and HNH nuclease domain
MAADMVGVDNLQQLFQSHVYKIDYYQREYSWRADDVGRLVTDLWKELQAKAENNGVRLR